MNKSINPIDVLYVSPAVSKLRPELKAGSWYAVRSADDMRGPYDNKACALKAYEPWACVVTDDPCQDDPSEIGGFTLYSFNRRHRSFKHPAELGIMPPNEFGEPVIEDEDLKRKLDEGLAFILGYSEHGNCCWSIGGRDGWDSRAVAGLMVLDPDYVHEDYESRKKHAVSCAEDYTAWCNGEVYRTYLLRDGEVLEDDSGTCYGQSAVHRWRDALTEHYGLDKKPSLAWPWELA